MNWISFAFKLISNREKVVELWNQLKPIIQESQDRLPQVNALLNEIDPSLLEGRTPTAQPDQPDTSFTVEWMQESLNKLDDADLTVDGDYGEKTREAVRAFQESRDLEPDGWAGIKTCVKIYQELQDA